jgi:glycosyltransferase involved in cell wall biosynthesis
LFKAQANKYVIITPAHNEQSYINYILESVVSQTSLPIQWIIVDDGSTDDTGKIIQKYCEKYPWIKLVENNNKGESRKGGVKVVRAFLLGCENLDISDYDVIVKLDADLTLPPEYFEIIMQTFVKDERIGLCGGQLLINVNGNWVFEKNAEYHLRGAIKAYRKSCLEQIGGIPITLNWDSLDEMKAMYLGWKVKVIPLFVKHHRVTSSTINRGLRYAYSYGKQSYKEGYDFILACARAVFFGMRTNPKIISIFWFIAGFLKGVISGTKREVDPSLASFMRHFQYNRIKMKLFGDHQNNWNH